MRDNKLNQRVGKNSGCTRINKIGSRWDPCPFGDNDNAKGIGDQRNEKRESGGKIRGDLRRDGELLVFKTKPGDRDYEFGQLVGPSQRLSRILHTLPSRGMTPRLREGATDYLKKPSTPGRADGALEDAKERRRQEND